MEPEDRKRLEEMQRLLGEVKSMLVALSDNVRMKLFWEFEANPPSGTLGHELEAIQRHIREMLEANR